MFSILITILSIALVAALVLAALYYGGSAFSQGQAAAQAAKLMLQGQQLLGAADLYKADTGQWPPSMAALLTSKYLIQIPVAGGPPGPMGTADAAAGDINIWVLPRAGVPLFVMRGQGTSVCKSVNKKAYGINGVLRSASTKYLMQCYGASPEELLLVVGRTGETLLEVAADPFSSVVLGPVTADSAPTNPLADSWLVAPGALKPVPSVLAPGPSVAYEGLGLSNGILAFPNTPAGSSCQERTIYVRNNGDTLLVMGSGASVPAPFTLVSSDCAGQALAPGAFCVVSVGFTPSTESTFSGGTFKLTWPDVGSLAALPLAGTGGAVVPGAVSGGPVVFNVGGSPATSWVFPDTPLGFSSAGQTIDIQNNTSGDWNFGANPVTVSGPFALTSNTCPSAKLSPSGTCKVTVVYLPATSGDSGASYPLAVTLPDGTSGSLALSGIGSNILVPIAQLSTLALNFGSVATNTTEKRQVMLSNPGTGVLALSALPELTASTSAAFMPGLTACGPSLAVSDSCITEVIYSPTLVGAATGTLHFSADVAGAPTEVTLSGTAFNPVSLAAGSVPSARLNKPYLPFNFSSLLAVSNEVAPTLADVAWSSTGALPAGLAFTNGVLAGTPSVLTEPAGASFEVLATYKSNKGQQVYTLQVGEAILVVTQISAGADHTCAITLTGGVKCWGGNAVGQLGDGTTARKLVPVDVTGLTSGVTRISAGTHYSCAVTSAGGALCWGENTNQKLGDGTTITRLVPVVARASGIVNIASGASHTCVLNTAGGVTCWGWNGNGQANAGPASGVVSLAVGATHTCVLTTTGGVKCWGYNSNGQIGKGNAFSTDGGGDVYSPTDVTGLTANVASISIGGTSSCAVTFDGAAWCWGNNSQSQIGSGAPATTKTYYYMPVKVSGLSNTVAQISVGAGGTACAILTSGGVKCWGNGASGQLGQGGPISSPTPLAIVGMSAGVSQLTIGSTHICAILTAGGTNCWGGNAAGQLGDGTFGTNRTAPVSVLE